MLTYSSHVCAMLPLDQLLTSAGQISLERSLEIARSR